MSVFIGRSLRQVVGLLVHIVGSLDYFGVRFVGALAGDQVDELVDNADVRLLYIALLEGSETLGAAGNADDRIAGCVCRKVQAIADGIEAGRVLEIGDSDLSR